MHRFLSLRFQFIDSLQRPLVRGILWLLSGKGLTTVISFSYFILLARSLGIEGYGQFSAVTNLVSIVFPFSSLGSGDILTKDVSRDETSFKIAWGNALLVTLFSSSVLIAVIMILGRFILPAGISLWTIFFICLSDTLLMEINSHSSRLLIAFGLYKTSSILDIFSVFSKLFAIAALMITFHKVDAQVWAFSYFIAAFIVTITTFLIIARTLGFPRFNTSRLYGNVCEGIYFSIGGCSEAFLGGIHMTMLASFSTLEVTGLYLAAGRLVGMALIPIFTLSGSVYPKFFAEGASGITGTLKFGKRLVPIVSTYGVVVLISFLCFGSFIPYLLGSEYTASIPAIYWLAPGPLIIGLQWISGDVLSCAGYQKIRSIVNVLFVVLTTLLTYYLISKYSWHGAAWSFLLSGALRFFSLWGIAMFLHQQESLSKKNYPIQK